MKPIIGVNCEYGDDGKCFLKKDYTDAIARSGGIPFILPIVEDKELLLEQVNLIDGLLLSGGEDILPEHFGEPPHEETKPVPKLKADFDLLLARHALSADMPVLGLCYGHQLINVCLGGSLIQDIPSQHETTIKHRIETGTHSVCIHKASMLHKILKCEYIEVNSTHHQAINGLGNGLKISAIDEDGIVEGVESTDHTFVVGVQWHPERLLDRDTNIELFKALVGAACSFREQR